MDIQQLKKEKTINYSENFFDETYDYLYKELLDLELDEQLSFLKDNYLKDKSDSKILDFCCGSGRHLIPLVKDNYLVDGIDINAMYIDSIKQVVPTRNIYCGDVRNFNKYLTKYDVIYSMESSIGYLDDTETMKIFKNVENILDYKGKFILHLINKEYLLRNFTSRMWFGNVDRGFVLEERSLNPNKGNIELRQLRIIGDKIKKYKVELRLYTLQEIKLTLEMYTNLKVKQVYGDFKANKFTIDSPYMIIEITKF